MICRELVLVDANVECVFVCSSIIPRLKVFMWV